MHPRFWPSSDLIFFFAYFCQETGQQPRLIYSKHLDFIFTTVRDSFSSQETTRFPLCGRSRSKRSKLENVYRGSTPSSSTDDTILRLNKGSYRFLLSQSRCEQNVVSISQLPPSAYRATFRQPFRQYERPNRLEKSTCRMLLPSGRSHDSYIT